MLPDYESLAGLGLLIVNLDLEVHYDLLPTVVEH